jgi:prepilin-type N-terminal cleavage/methylation domain-containing protein
MRLLINKTQNKHTGFSLIELLVVISLISLVASLSGSRLVGAFEKLKLDKTANDLLLAAQYARVTAIEKQKQYKLYLDTKNNEFYLVTPIFDETNGYLGEEIVQDTFCKPVTLENDIKFEDIEVTPIGIETNNLTNDLSIIVFSPDGTAQTAVVQIGNGQTHYTLSVIAATGKVKLYPGTIDNVKITTVDLDAG